MLQVADDARFVEAELDTVAACGVLDALGRAVAVAVGAADGLVDEAEGAVLSSNWISKVIGESVPATPRHSITKMRLGAVPLTPL